MRVNEHQAILTPKLLLVPYSEHHVPTYHEWMQDEELQQATASEPLTLPEEYDMQKSWRTDADKLTFIVCTAPPTPPPLSGTPSSTPPALSTPSLASTPSTPNPEPSSTTSTPPSTNAPTPPIELCKITQPRPGDLDNPTTMIGDINLFLYPADNEDEDEDPNQPSLSSTTNPILGEIEIMIARRTHQNRGLGRSVLLTFLWYIMSSLDAITQEYHAANGVGKPASQLKYLRVKIDAENARSIRLFESAGFVRMSETPNYFGELEFRRVVGGDLEEMRTEVEKELGRLNGEEGEAATGPVLVEYV